MQTAEIGVIGLATMGAHLARNLANKKIKTLVYNRTGEKTQEYIQKYGNAFLEGAFELEDFVRKIEKPRKILMMVKAGTAIDEVIRELTPLLEPGDIIIDGGNSFYSDSERRMSDLYRKRIHFMSCGISGGEEGALYGPSLMPSGSHEAWSQLQPLFETIAARDFQQQPCVTYIGEGASGHYVKMVHNAIEYGMMQLMAETYTLLKNGFGIDNDSIAAIFEKLHQGKLNSFLFQIAIEVLKRRDEFQEGYLLDFILDKAEQKGTGAWTTHEALTLGVAVPTLSEAVFARFISVRKEERVLLNTLYDGKGVKISQISNEQELLEKFLPLLEDALYGAMISTYAQGYDLIFTASQKNQWQINLAEISRIWQGGCIIRAELLKLFYEAYYQYPEKHLFAIPNIAQLMNETLPAWKRVLFSSIEKNIPLSAFSNSLFYFQNMTTAHGSANFIQGLRDYFGAHNYERIDREGVFHTLWKV